MHSFPKSNRDAHDFVEGMMTNRPSEEQKEERRDQEMRKDQKAIQEMEDFWEGLLQEISNIITKKRDTFDKMKVFRFKHLEYYIQQDRDLEFVLEKDFTEENFEILKDWCDGKMEEIISIFNGSDDHVGNLEFILGHERLPRVPIDYTERKNKFTAMSKIINTPKTLRSKKNYMKIADICRLLNFFREIDWDDEINNKSNFFNNMKEMNGYGPGDMSLNEKNINLKNWFGRGKEFLGSSEGEKKESSSPKKTEPSKKAVLRGICPLCKKDVTTAHHGRVKDAAGTYYHEKCNKFKNAGWESRISKSNQGKTMYWHKDLQRKPIWKLPNEPSAASVASVASTPSAKLKKDPNTLKAFTKKRRGGGKRTRRKSKKKLRSLSRTKRKKRTRKRRKKRRKTTRKKY